MQGRGPVSGDLSRDDDRPLYWARLGMTRELRGWEPRFGLDEARRGKLLDTLERTSRGQTAIRYPQGKGLKRVLVTGFDPFTLDRDIRISNPSGAVALALDGTVIETASGPARVETAVFPVRWRDFTDGTVERALRPHLPEADLFTTVSQGRVGRIDVERTNGAWRGGFGDNENTGTPEVVPVSDPASQPQWTSTTLPYAAITAADTGRFPVYDNTSVTEIPAGARSPSYGRTGRPRARPPAPGRRRLPVQRDRLPGDAAARPARAARHAAGRPCAHAGAGVRGGQHHGGDRPAVRAQPAGHRRPGARDRVGRGQCVGASARLTPRLASAVPITLFRTRWPRSIRPRIRSWEKNSATAANHSRWASDMNRP